MADSVAAAPRVRLSPRQRRIVILTVEYALFAIAVVAAAVLADWGTLRDNFADGAVAAKLFPEILTVGLRNTVIYTISGFALGLALGMVIALMRLSSAAPYRWVALAYIEVFRGIPALLVFIFMGPGFSLAFPDREIPGGVYGQAAVALGLVSAAYMAETIRAGIQAVPTGQTEAARSLGMSHGRAMRSIVIPQALRIVIPPLTNELVLLFKDSSLALFLGVVLSQRELTKFANDLANEQANSTPYLIAALCYLLITIPLGILVRRLEARQNRGRR